MKKDVKKKLARRLKIVAGQVRGLEKMVEEETYCIEIITQSSAVRNALSAVEDVLLENHLATCASKQMRVGKQTQAIDEILAVYKLAKKK